MNGFGLQLIASTFQSCTRYMKRAMRPPCSGPEWPQKSMEKVKTALLLLLTALVALVSGCSHSSETEVSNPGYIGIISIQPPPFLTGPAGALLTNASGYSAVIETQADSLSARPGARTGQLLCRGSKLLFAPDPNEPTGKRGGTGGLLFIWDVAQGKGYVVSEALQGYAPASLGTQVTNVIAHPEQVSPQTVSGHSCAVEQDVVQMSDGATAGFQAWRATDLNGVALRISGVTNSVSILLTLSKARIEMPGADLFLPPDGFTQYSSPEALADELVARKRNLRRKGPVEEIPFTPMNPGVVPGTGGPY